MATLHAIIMSRIRILDHIRIILILPAVWLTYQLLANGSVTLFPLTKSFFKVWRYLSEILICIGCLISCYFITPKAIRNISLVTVFVFYVLNLILVFLIPMDIGFEKIRLLNLSIYLGTAIIAYVVIVITYEKQRMKRHA